MILKGLKNSEMTRAGGHSENPQRVIPRRLCFPESCAALKIEKPVANYLFVDRICQTIAQTPFEHLKSKRYFLLRKSIANAVFQPTSALQNFALSILFVETTW